MTRVLTILALSLCVLTGRGGAQASDRKHEAPPAKVSIRPVEGAREMLWMIRGDDLVAIDAELEYRVEAPRFGDPGFLVGSMLRDGVRRALAPLTLEEALAPDRPAALEKDLAKLLESAASSMKLTLEIVALRVKEVAPPRAVRAALDLGNPSGLPQPLEASAEASPGPQAPVESPGPLEPGRPFLVSFPDLKLFTQNKRMVLMDGVVLYHVAYPKLAGVVDDVKGMRDEVEGAFLSALRNRLARTEWSDVGALFGSDASAGILSEANKHLEHTCGVRLIGCFIPRLGLGGGAEKSFIERMVVVGERKARMDVDWEYTAPPEKTTEGGLLLHDLGQVIKLDGHHRISIPRRYRIVDRFSAGRPPPWLLHRRAPGVLHARNLQDGREVEFPIPRTLLRPGRSHGAIEWSEDGTRFFGFEAQIVSVDVRTKAVQGLTRIRQGRSPEWLPGSMVGPRRYLYLGGRDRLVTVLDRFGKGRMGEGTAYPKGAQTVILDIDLRTGAEKVLVADERRVSSWDGTARRGLLYLLRDSEMELRKIDGSPLRRMEVSGEWMLPQLSPDAERILFEQRWAGGKTDTGFFVCDAESLEVRHHFEVGRVPRWDRYGDWIAYIRNHSELWVTEREGRVKMPVVSIDTKVEEAHAYFARPAWLGNRRIIAVGLSASRGKWQHSMYTLIVNMERREVVVIPEHWQSLSWVPRPVGVFK